MRKSPFSIVLVFIAVGCSEKENSKTAPIATTADTKIVVEAVSTTKTTPGEPIGPALVPPQTNEKREKREAVKKLVADRKAELVKAKASVELGTVQAAKSRTEAEEAAETETVDYKVYLRARQLDKTNDPNLPDAIRYVKSKKAASEALQRARQAEAERVQAVEAKAEIQAALRRAEELLAQLGSD